MKRLSEKREMFVLLTNWKFFCCKAPLDCIQLSTKSYQRRYQEKDQQSPGTTCGIVNRLCRF